MITLALYEKVYKDLFNKIRSGYYKKGDLLPSEKKMEEMYEMSRAPIRQALSKLSNNGFIERKPGKGTFVTQNEVIKYKGTFGGFAEHYSHEWNDISCKTLEVKNTTTNKYIAEKLGLDEGSKVIFTLRIRYLKNKPIFYLKHFCSKVDVQSIKEEKDFKSMPYLLVEKFGLEIEYVLENLVAISANKEVSKHLKIKEDSPILKVERISYDSHYIPIDYVEYFVRSEYWDYQVMFNKTTK